MRRGWRAGSRRWTSARRRREPVPLTAGAPPDHDGSEDHWSPVRDLALLLMTEVGRPPELLAGSARAVLDLLTADGVTVSRYEPAAPRSQAPTPPALTLPVPTPPVPTPPAGALPGLVLGLPVLTDPDAPVAARQLATAGRMSEAALAPSGVTRPAARSSAVPSASVGVEAGLLVVPLDVGQARWGELLAVRGQGWDPGSVRLAHVVAPLLANAFVLAGEVQRLQVLAWSDSLTALANRRAFDERLTSLLETLDAAAEPGTLSVVLADVNGLKEVNDRSGHQVGDEVLRMVAGHARGVVADVPGALAARLGGDEFALLLPGFGARRAYRYAASWCLRVADELTGVSLACGLSTHAPGRTARSGRPDPEALRAELVRAADAATYTAKRTGTRHPVRAAGF